MQLLKKDSWQYYERKQKSTVIAALLS